MSNATDVAAAWEVDIIYVEISVMLVCYLVLLVVLVHNTWKFIIKQWHSRMTELKILYLFSIIQVLLRITEFLLLYPNQSIESPPLQASIRALGLFSSAFTIGFGLP